MANRQAKNAIVKIGVEAMAAEDALRLSKSRYADGLSTYIDLNPLRAGMVNQPEKYRWNSIGYHLQTHNKDNFLSTDFGLKEFNVKSSKERIRRYRRYMYEAGSIDKREKGKIKVIDPRMLATRKKKEFEVTQASRLRYRTRYFTDSGIIGSKEFVSTHYQRFKHLFVSKHKIIPKPIEGLSGIYSYYPVFFDQKHAVLTQCSAGTVKHPEII